MLPFVVEQLSKPKYSSIKQYSSLFKMGVGTDLNGNSIDVSNSITKGIINEGKVEGRTVTNELGTEGNFETQGNWHSNLILDNTESVFDSYCGKIDNSAGTTEKAARNFKELKLSGKYVLFSAYVKSVSGTPNAEMLLLGLDSSNNLVETFPHLFNVNNTWNRYAFKIDLSSKSHAKYNSRFDINTYGTVDDVIKIDGAMVQEITQDEYNNLTTDELLTKYPYINNTTHTTSGEYVARGKNKAKLPKESLNYVGNGANLNLISQSDGTVKITGSTGSSGIALRITDVFAGDLGSTSGRNNLALNQNIAGKGQHTLQLTTTGTVALASMFIAYDDTVTTFTSPHTFTSINKVNAIIVQLGTNLSNIDITVKTQLEPGSTASPYEPYESNEDNPLRYILPFTAKRLPNGVADYVDFKEGKAVKGVSELELPSSNITAISNGTNVQFVNISKSSDFIGYNNTNKNEGQAKLEGYGIANTVGTLDDVQYENKLATHYSNTNLTLVVPLNTFIDLADAQTKLAGTVLNYQLATPIEYLNGENGFKITGTLPSYGIGTTVEFRPIKQDIDGNWIVANSSESTIPTSTLDVPTNKSAQTDSNTTGIIKNNESISSLWETLLPLADKELQMYSIALIVDPAVATTTELGNKINEILGVWK